MFGNLASDWGLYTILICLPMFLLDILHFDIQTVGVVFALLVLFYQANDCKIVFNPSSQHENSLLVFAGAYHGLLDFVVQI